MASVKVAVRVRPLNKRETDLHSSVIISMEGNRTCITNKKLPSSSLASPRTPNSSYTSPVPSPRSSVLLSPRAAGDSGSLGRERVKQFTYDYSYWSLDVADDHYSSQEKLYEDLGRDVVTSAYDGYNACIFAYGQTGSGKTYTMMGTEESIGLIPRICQALFIEMADSETTYRTEVSYLEIYNERVRDLLRDKTQAQHNLKVREHPKQGPYVQDLSKHIVVSYEDIHELITMGNANRTTAVTNMNEHSSRSHAIFSLVFTQATFKDDIPSEISSKINLVDLAGSERADASGATGDRLKEGGSINKSLVTLGNVISTLADMAERVVSPRRSIFIPYRDSVLTWLLKDSLGGNAKTIMIATISPADCNYAETLSTLRYANRAKKIMNKPTINEDPNVKLIRELREENARLKELLSANEDWFLTKKRLNRNEERMKELTDKWTDKWNETASVLQEHKMLALRKEGSSVVLDSELPYLLCIDDNILSTGMKLYHLKEGDTVVGNGLTEQQPDMALASPYILDTHCMFSHKNGEVYLIPCQDSRCSVNNRRAHEPTRLNQGDVIRLGRRHLFRFNHPCEAAKLREQIEANSHDTDQLVEVLKGVEWTWSKSNTSLTDSAVGSDFDFVDLDPGEQCRHEEELNQLERKRKELEELREEQLHAEAHRLAQLAEQESNKKEIERKQKELEKTAERAKRLKEQAAQVHEEIEKISSHLEQKAKLQAAEKEKFAEEQEVLEQEKERIEKEKQKAREERQKLRKKRELQKAKAEVEKLRQETEWEQLKNEKERIMREKQTSQEDIEKEKRKIEEARKCEIDSYKSESVNMRQLVECELNDMRKMAGLEPALPEAQNEPEKEDEDYELRLEDLIGQDVLVPALPEVYLQPSASCEEGPEEPVSDLEVSDTTVTQWTPEEILSRLVELGIQVKDVHTTVCRSLEEKYRSGLSTSGNTEKLSQQVIDQFHAIKPLYDQLEKALAVQRHEPSMEETLRDYDHKLTTTDRFLQIDSYIQAVHRATKDKQFLKVIGQLDSLNDVMDKLDIEHDIELGVQKNLRIEMCLIRENFLYELSETWNGLLKWILPAESRRLAHRPRTVTLEVTGIEKHQDTLACAVQAMYSVNILESRIKTFCDRLMTYFIQPVVQDHNTLLQVIEESEKYICVVINPPAATAKSPVPPLEVFPKLEQIFTFIHKPLEFVNIEDFRKHNNGQSKSESKVLTLVEKIGSCLCKKLFECIYNDCLSHAIPRSTRQYENFNEIVAVAEEFQNLLSRLQFMTSDQASLLDYLNNVNTLFANIKGQEILKKASEQMTQELTQNVRICSDNPLGFCSKDGKIHPTESFVKECKQQVGTVNLKLPTCQVSLPVRSLMCLAYDTLRDAVTTGHDGAAHLCHSVHNMFELYCDVMPSYHRERLKNMPLMAALHHNNCMFVAHHLITVDKVFSRKLRESSPGGPSRESGLSELIPKVKRLGKESFNEHLNVKKEELCDQLIAAEGFECVADDEGEGAGHAVKVMLHHLRHVSQVWRHLLPTNTYCKATGSLLNAALEDIIDCVLSIEEFSVEDCEYLQKVLSQISDNAVQVFDMGDPNLNPQVLVHEHVPAWFRFKELLLVLASGLQQISDRWADGKGPLSMHFTSDEVRRLVMAMFENTSKRDIVLKQLRRPSVANLADL